MKLALLVALCAVTAAGVFKPGQEYVYHYKGQVLSGIPKSSKQYAGILIDSLVVMQFQQNQNVVMKMEKITLYKVNNKIDSLPSEALPESELTRLTGEQASVITQSLVKPIKFRYEEGAVRELEKEASDPYWSVNIKKGVLSLFQVTLKKKTPYSSGSTSSFYPDPLMTSMNFNRARYPPTYTYGRGRSYAYSKASNTPSWNSATQLNTAFKVVETDVMGSCESKYTIVSSKDQLSAAAPQLFVSRVKDFDSCTGKPFHVEGIFQGVHHSSTEKDLMQPAVATDLVLTGDRSHFLIREATLRGKYSFQVNGLQGGDLSTYIFQHLALKTMEPIRQPLHLVSPKVDPKGLLMVIPKSSLIPETQTSEAAANSMFSLRRHASQENFLRSSYGRQPYYQEEEQEEDYSREELTDLKPAVEAKLEELIQCLYPSSVDKKCSFILYQLSRVLREMNKPQLKETIMSHLHGQQSSQVEYRKTEILLDILPTLPSPDAAKVLVELIQDRHISELRGSLLVKAMTMLVVPTPSVVTKLWELFKQLPKQPSSAFTESKILRQAILLGVGTLTHRLTNVMRSEDKPVPEVILFIETIGSELTQLLEAEPSLEEKILVLKAMGNMGIRENILPLKSLIEDPSQPPVIKVNAVFALRRLAKEFDKEVTPILLTSFMNLKELREVRQAAFVVLLSAQPSYTTLQMIAHRVRHESSSQIRTLVYSSLVNLAMYTQHQPELKQVAKNARLIMKILPPVTIGVHDSVSVLLNKFSEEYDLGGALNLIKIKSPMSGLPDSLVANLQGTLFGKHRKLIEVGASGKSLESILKKVFGPYGLLTEYLKGSLSVDDILKPLSKVELGQVEQKIRQILSQMMQESGPELEAFGVTSNLYLQVLGNELQFITINSHNIKEVIEKVSEVIPELLMKLSRGVNVDIVKTISHFATVNVASPLGIPLSLNATTMGVLKVEGHVKVDGLPNFSEMFNRFSSLELNKIKFNIDLKPLVDAVQTINMGADLRWLTTGVGAKVAVQTQLPIKLQATIDTPRHSLTLKNFIPKEPMKLLNVMAGPSTYLKYQPMNMERRETIKEIHELKAEEIVNVAPFQYEYPLSLVGLEVEAQGVLTLCGSPGLYCPIMPLFGKQEFSLVTRPISDVDFVQLKVKSLSHNLQFEGVPFQTNPEDLFVKDPEDFEEEHNYYHSQSRPEVSRSMLASGEFEPITVSPVFSSQPIKRQILITVGPSNNHSPKVKALLTWLMNRQHWKHQFNIQAVQPSHGQVPTWKVILDTTINPLVFYPEEYHKTTPLVETKLMWNVYEHQNEIKIQIMPGSPFVFSKELKEHTLLPAPLSDPTESSATKYTCTLEMEVQQTTHKLMKYITMAQNLLKYQFFSKLSTSIPVQPLNKVIVSLEVIPWWEKMNVILKTPRETSLIPNIPLYWNPFHPTSEKMRFHDIPAWKWYKSLEDKEHFLDTVPYKPAPIFGGNCTFTPSGVTTLDGASFPSTSLIYGLRNQKCDVMISQHCTDEGLFSIHVLGDSQEGFVRVLVPKNEILVLKKRHDVVVKVNGEEKEIPLGGRVVITDPTDNTARVVIKCPEPTGFVVELPELGAEYFLNYVTMHAYLTVSPLSMLQGQLCGLCGNFNQDQSDDLDTPSDFQLANRDIVRTITKNIISRPGCDLQKFKIVSNDICTKPVHHVIKRYHDQLHMTCTSHSPVPQCAPGCYPDSTTSVKTCFTCHGNGSSLPAQTYIPPRWGAYDNQSISCPDFYQRVEVPNSCVQVY